MKSMKEGKGGNFYVAKYIDKKADYDYVWGLKTIE